MHRGSSVVETIRKRAGRKSELHAYTFLNQSGNPECVLTLGELDRRAAAIGNCLSKTCSKGSRALLLYPSGQPFIEAFLGCLYAGVIAVPAYPPGKRQRLKRLNAVATDAGASIALSTASVVSRLSEFSDTFSVPTLATDDIDHVHGYEPVTCDGESLAFLQYTSGSTATPKGVMVSHRNLAANLAAMQDTLETREDGSDVLVTWLPQFHDMGLVLGMLLSLFSGFRCVAMKPETFIQQPMRWLEAISEYGGTISAAPNFAYDLCVRRATPDALAGLDLRTWRVALNGAEPVRATTVEAFVKTFSCCGFSPGTMRPGYGLAEATLMVSSGSDGRGPVLMPLDAAALSQNTISVQGMEDGGRVLVGCGTIHPSTELLIVDPETLQVCGPSSVGEVWLRNTSVALGYWGRERETEQTFRAFTAGGDGPYLRTGDLGFLRDGQVFITGRCKDLIVIQGRNLYPQDIEETVEGCHEALRPSCGAAIPVVEAGEERLAIVYEVKRQALKQDDFAAVFGAIQQEVAIEHQVAVHEIVLIRTGAAPKTSSGKIQRREIRRQLRAGELPAVASWRRGRASNETPPGISNQDDLIDLIRVIAARHLEIDVSQIAPSDVLAHFGLSSLTAASIAQELSARLGREVSPTLLYDYPAIQALAKHLGWQPVRAAHQAGEGDRPASREPLAIVGMACRFPGADGPEAFWKLLESGGCAVSRVPAERRRGQLTDRTSGHSSEWAAMLAGIDQFDFPFFGISQREASCMDPQQLLLLQTTWHALEDAGIPPINLAGSESGVFIGISASDHFRLELQNTSDPDPYLGTGGALSIAAGRISYFLDLKGPSLAVDTACSSSLMAVHLARQSLALGECDLAIVGGVNLLLSSDHSQVFERAGMLSPDGKLRAFDASANGYVRGEGCGVVILQRLSQARRSGIRIRAVLRGTAVNQDGRSNGLTAPNGPSQQEVVRRAIRNAGSNPRDINYVETHGTGTPLGDPIEVNSLGAVLGVEGGPCYLSSVKTNIGHLESAAGIAGLIKGVLALENGRIPGNAAFSNLNPEIRLDNTRLRISAESVEWPQASGKARLAGVSSFGFSGTNVHAVIEEAPSEAHATEPDREERFRLLPLSARTTQALSVLGTEYSNWLTGSTESWRNISFSAAVGRSHLPVRAAVVAQSSAHAAAALASGVDRLPCKGTAARDGRPKVAFVFTGQGSQWRGMGSTLYRTQPAFRETLDRLDAVCRQRRNWSLLDALFQGERLDDTERAQPAIVALELALADLWKSWGIQPDALLGHSVGEFAAVAVAGVLDPEDALGLVLERGRLMQSLPRSGAMAAVFGDSTVVEAAVAAYPGKLSVAAYNGPAQVVISGDGSALHAALGQLRGQGIQSRDLTVSHAFHSPLMNPIVDEFAKLAGTVPCRRPNIAIVSSFTGRPVADETFDGGYWARQILAPVRFQEAMHSLLQTSCGVVIELGPKAILTDMAQAFVQPEHDVLWLSSLRPPEDETRTILQSLGGLYVRGAAIEWPAVHAGERCRPVTHPAYPFQGRPLKKTPTSVSIPAPAETARPEHGAADVVSELIRMVGGFMHSAPEEIDADMPLIEMGADSLVMVRAVRAIESRYQVSIPIRRLFKDTPTLRKLAESIVRESAKPALAAPSAAASIVKPQLPPPLPAKSVLPAWKAPETSVRALTAAQREHLDRLIDSYTNRTRSSREYAERNRPHLSDNRASAGFRLSTKEMLYPIVGTRSVGSRIWDLDGNEYVDLTMGFGVNLYGHQPAFVTDALQRQVSDGIQLGPQAMLAGEVAQAICRLTGFDRVAFSNTGTEAVMTALRLVRTVTGRSRVALFAGSYHGHSDGVLGEVGPGGEVEPVTPGVCAGMVENLVVLDYGSPESLARIEELHRSWPLSSWSRSRAGALTFNRGSSSTSFAA
jgi:acyl transferase domain-containing protein/acyl-CoA synthetase (AMP-forming)/AMP-acid ligase II